MIFLSSISNDATKEIQKNIDQSLQEVQNVGLHNWDQAFIKFLTGIGRFSLKVILAFVVFYLGRKCIYLIMKPIGRFLVKSRLSDSATGFMTKLIDTLLSLVLILIILLGIGVNASAVAAFIGSVGIVIGLAVQGSLSNLAGGILLVGTKPFELNHWIIESTHNYQGKVTEIGMFYTKLMTPDNQEIIIPNGLLANATIVNLSKQATRRVDLRYVIKYEVDFEKVKEKILQLISSKQEVINEDSKVLVESMDTMGVHILVVCWCQNEDLIPLRFSLHQEIFQLLQREDIFVQQQIHLQTLDSGKTR